MSKDTIIWLIDENQDQLKTFGEQLSKIFNEDGQVRAIEPKSTKEEMKFIIDNPKTVSIVIDERLKETGIAKFFGIELAQYLRALNTKVPIYILTNYSKDDFESGKWSVEYILDKKDFDTDFNTIKARMLRNVSFYHDYLDQREKRFNDLLNKSLHSTISKEEIKEFEELQYVRVRSILADELGISPELDKKIKEQLEIISELEKN